MYAKTYEHYSAMILDLSISLCTKLHQLHKLISISYILKNCNQPARGQCEKYFRQMIDVFHPSDMLFLKTGCDLLQWHFAVNKNWSKCLEYGRMVLPFIR